MQPVDKLIMAEDGLRAGSASEKPDVFLVYHEGNIFARMVVSALGNTGFPIAMGTTYAALKTNVAALLFAV